MARVRCPECGLAVKIPADHDRAFIRCPDCNFKIRLDDSEEVKPARPKKSKKKQKEQTAAILSLLPLLLIIPLVSFLCLAGFHRVLGGIGSCFGIVICITAAIMAYLVARREGLATGDDLNPFLQRIPIVQIFFQFSWAIQRPLKVGPWVAVEIVGIIATIGSFTIGEARNAMEARGPVNPIERPDPSKAGIDRLLADLEGGDRSKAAAAADKLAKIPANERQPEVARKLLDAVNSDNFFVRQSAVKALATWATTDQVPELVELTNHQDRRVRIDAIDVLGGIKDERTYQPLARALCDFATQRNAKDALIRTGPPAEKEVLAVINDPTAQRITIEVLKEIGTQQSVPALEKLKKEFLARQPAEDALKSINARIQK